MRVFLCEKPSQARDIAPHVGARSRGDGCIKGDGVAVTWCIGHLLEQAGPECYSAELKTWTLASLPVIPDRWQMLVVPSTKSQFAIVRKILAEAREVVIATDADREGEVIAREVLDLVGYRGQIQRLWLTALNAPSIKLALSRLQPEAQTRNLYHSGLGRSRADWLAGMNFTRALTVAFSAGRGRRGVLTCGRVQTPVLGLIVRRERAIKNFMPKTFFILDAAFLINGVTLPMDWMAPKDRLDDQGHCVRVDLVKAVADAIRGQVGRVVDVTSTPERELAPLLHYLGSLQKEASARFGLKAQAVLDACQALYEKHKATTYPRTDCEYLPQTMFSEVPDVIQSLVAVDPSLAQLAAAVDTTTPGRCFNDKKITAHHAIIPTNNPSVQLREMSKSEQLVYDMIRRRYLSQFLGDHHFTKTVLQVDCVGHRFSKTGKVTVRPGWHRADPQPTAAGTSHQRGSPGDTKEAVAVLPVAKVGDAAKNTKAEVATKKTEPPKRYTEGTLITAMESIDKEIEDPRFKQVMKNKEKAGIGTEATRSSIIASLFLREYIATEKKWLVPTDKGGQFIELLERIAPGLVDPVLTAHWEERLMQIEAGQVELPAFESEIASWLTHTIEDIKQQAGSVKIGAPDPSHGPVQKSANPLARGITCPQCKKHVLRMISGPRGVFWGCGGYPDSCKATFPDKEGKPVLDRATAPAAVAGATCPTCMHGKLVLRELKDKGKKFLGCTDYPQCPHFQWVA